VYYRDDNIINKKEKPEDQTTKRYIIKDIFNLIDDEIFNINLGIASHNFRIFNLNSNLYGIGGQSLGIENYNKFKNTTNMKYIEFIICFS
jgi:hypothetical protein